MSKFIIGGWSQSLAHEPLRGFDIMMYGMVTNLQGLTTGSSTNPGWSPEKSHKPAGSPDFNGKTLWVYGGGGCSPAGKPANMEEVSRIVEATLNMAWDGVDFDDECNMNINLVIEAMAQLKKCQKETSFGFISGYSYNHPQTNSGAVLNNKIKSLVQSGQCDRLIHYCYAAAMWSKQDIIANVIPALDRTMSHGAGNKQCILALTSRGLTDWSLNYFIDQVLDFALGGLFIWNYEKLTADHYQIIKDRLSK
ncbi:hypothetical protein [Erwinia amylovora]|uniref:Uncharacterized protein n=3 Tax=Erwinia amylovora TaxID=552 RepID=A0A831EQN4_ERWAM|nr:hypothetical protein [Erwinia amylovora]CDK15246.1 hypothetical protein LA635_1622 [Erwinia amylovora LA635]CDK18613.1 hypothetical protein LA636_1621 [Erwinia amylovora LA636]CDK21982.1 hypothetical protein LA637_1622 [Erwinia amylovora LA637]ATZ11554.1 hypothetical protein AD997_08805 [Erwinia amylovora]EKV54462.1 hypothetical protein EaACW_1766 [Erwinia amylovora ACW56400]